MEQTMEQWIRKLASQMVEHIEANPPNSKESKVHSYHLQMKEKPNIRMSVIYRPRMFVISVHYVDGPQRGYTLARIVDDYSDVNKGSYYNDDILYPEYNVMQKMWKKRG